MPVPYPAPSSPAVSAVMRANRKRDTGPELRLRSALHRRGLRYRLDVAIVADGVRVVPDVVFPSRRVAVFVDGCWWHRCPEHANEPKANTAYWLPKLAKNVERDRRVDAALRAGGWTIVRVWEHEDPSTAADVAASVLAGMDRVAPERAGRACPRSTLRARSAARIEPMAGGLSEAYAPSCSLPKSWM